MKKQQYMGSRIKVVAVLAVAALVVLTGGCSASPKADSAASDSRAQSAPESSSSTSTPTWRSGENLPNAPKSESEWAAYDSYISSMAEAESIEVPYKVEVVRWETPSEQVPAVAACVRDAGFPATDDGQFGMGVPKEQMSAFLKADYECLAAHPPISKYSAPFNEAQLKMMYQWTVETEIPCLRQAGYEISDAPSQQTFIDQWHNGKPFFPFNDVPTTLTNDEWAALDQKCPQTPPNNVLYGG